MMRSTMNTSVGVMPNLKAIIDNYSKLAPDLYIRDHGG
jgi:hypothetical protein